MKKNSIKSKWTRKDIVAAVIVFSIIVMAIVAIICGFIYHYNIRRDIYANPILSKGIILLWSAGKGGYSLTYEYRVNSMVYRGNGGFHYKKDLFLVGDSCLILYNKQDPSKSLLFKDENGRVVFFRKRR